MENGDLEMGTRVTIPEETEAENKPVDQRRSVQDDLMYCRSYTKPRVSDVILMINETQNPKNPSIFAVYRKRIQCYLANVMRKHKQDIPSDVLYMIAQYLVPDARIAGFSESYEQLIIFDTETLLIHRIDNVPPSWQSDSVRLRFGNMESSYIADISVPLLPFFILERDMIHNPNEIKLFVMSTYLDALASPVRIFAMKLELSSKERQLETNNSFVSPRGFITQNQLLFLYCDIHRELSIWSVAKRTPKCLYTIVDGHAYDWKLKLSAGLLYFPSLTNNTFETKIFDVSALLTSTPNSHDHKTCSPRYIRSTSFTRQLCVLQNGIVLSDNIGVLQLSNESIVAVTHEKDYCTQFALMSIPVYAKRSIHEADYQVSVKLHTDRQFTALPGNRFLTRVGIIDMVNCEFFKFHESLFSRSVPLVSFESESSDRFCFVEQFF